VDPHQDLQVERLCLGAQLDISTWTSCLLLRNALQFGSLSVLLAMLFGGFLLSRNKMPGWIGWAANVSYVR
jgi:hypothetical protein